jgi:hypothetical protein
MNNPPPAPEDFSTQKPDYARLKDLLRDKKVDFKALFQDWEQLKKDLAEHLTKSTNDRSNRQLVSNALPQYFAQKWGIQDTKAFKELALLEAERYRAHHKDKLKNLLVAPTTFMERFEEKDPSGEVQNRLIKEFEEFEEQYPDMQELDKILTPFFEDAAEKLGLPGEGEKLKKAIEGLVHDYGIEYFKRLDQIRPVVKRKPVEVAAAEKPKAKRKAAIGRDDYDFMIAMLELIPETREPILAKAHLFETEYPDLDERQEATLPFFDKEAQELGLPGQGEILQRVAFKHNEDWRPQLNKKAIEKAQEFLDKLGTPYKHHFFSKP